MTCVIRFIRSISNLRMIHLHAIGTNLGIVLDSYLTDTSLIGYQRIWESISVKLIFTHRSDLTATIDAESHLSLVLNGDSTITTHQSRVAVGILTLTSAEYVAHDDRCTSTSFKSYRHICIPFYSANLTTAIDRTFHHSVTDGDICCILGSFITHHHGFLTGEGVGFTLTTTIDIACDIGTLHVLVCTHRIETVIIHTFVQFNLLYRTDINGRDTNDVGFVTSTVNSTDLAQLIRIIAGISRHSIGIFTWNHVDVHGRITIHISICAITATEHLTNLCC